ncbi:MAG TPA: FG-GAP-like repeat-containing protein [bacterium]|nr:FG-GAP-like repeat-containing protein [bacterium]
MPPHRHPSSSPAIPLLVAVIVLAAAGPATAQWTFTDVSVASGAGVAHTVNNLSQPSQKTTGGVACGDYNNDGWLDLYALGGNLGSNHLLRNNGDGTFSDVAGPAGVANAGTWGCGAVFADWNGDGWLDLFVGGVQGTRYKLYESDGDGTFTDVTDSTGIRVGLDTYSASFGDPDRDGDLDLIMAHWTVGQGYTHLFRNDGNGPFCTQFAPVDSLWGYTSFRSSGDYTFAHNFADLNSDGWTDFVCASDYNTSHVYLNDGDGTFTDVTDTTVINDDNGMGSTVADYDRDGDLDWFVTSIYDSGGVPKNGNRMYRNLGDGTFEDATDHAGVRDGLWGWAATFQDFNNDGWLDIFHVNGWQNGWDGNPSRMFVANGDCTFTEQAAALGTANDLQGRGVAAFDYDRDGDIDLFLSNTNANAVLFRNDGGNDGHWLDVKLTGPAPNTEQIGARVLATVAGATQLWEMRCGNNFLSQDPAEAHFGLGGATVVDELEVQWPDGTTTILQNVPADQRLVLSPGGPTGAAPTVSAPRDGLVLIGAAPNPSRAGTVVRFQTDRAARTRIRVYDAAGRAVETLLDELLPAGSHAVTWTGRDAEGSRAASGIYYYVVRSGNLEASGRLALIR